MGNKGRPYGDDVQAEVTAACRENRPIRDEVGLSLHEKGNPVKVIRRFCLECMGGSSDQVLKCTSVGCELWPYRRGKNPFRKTQTHGFGHEQE